MAQRVRSGIHDGKLWVGDASYLQLKQDTVGSPLGIGSRRGSSLVYPELEFSEMRLLVAGKRPSRTSLLRD
jgi:hypothetical protein